MYMPMVFAQCFTITSLDKILNAFNGMHLRLLQKYSFFQCLIETRCVFTVCSWGTYGMNCANTCGSCENNAACNNVDGACRACLTEYLYSVCKGNILYRFSFSLLHIQCFIKQNETCLYSLCIL